MSKRETKDTISHVDGQQPAAVINDDAAQKVDPAISEMALASDSCSQSGESDCEDVGDSWKDWGWKKADFECERGEADGRRWAMKAHPNELRLFCGHFRKWNKPCLKDDSPLWIRLLKSLPDFKDRGARYSDCFVTEVRSEYSRIATAWAHLNYAAGLRDGESWARDVESAEKLSRLQAKDQREGWNPEYCEDQLFEPEYSPAQGLLYVLLTGDRDDHWNVDEPSEAVFEKEFKSVWERFVSEPLDDVSCKLLVPEYVLGFGNGALGRTEQLEARFFNRKETSRLPAPQQRMA